MNIAASSSEVVEREVRVDAPPETVFSFFTDPLQMTKWKGQSATLDPRPGGIYRVVMSENDVARGEYVEVVPYTRVVFTFGWEGEGNPLPPGSSTVEVSFTPDGDGTIVRLRHFGLGPEMRRVHSDGWALYLPRLPLAAIGQDPGPLRSM